MQLAQPRRAVRVRGRWSVERQQALWGVLFVAPAVLYFGVFSLYPMLSAVVLSFFDYDLLQAPRFAGLEVYRELFSSAIFRNSLRVTALYVALVTVPIWVLALGLAELLNRQLRLRGFFRTIYFTPTVIALVVVAVIWRLMYNGRGPINAMLDWLTPPVPWLTSGTFALDAVAITAVWRGVGYYAVIFLAGLQNIPHEYREAARIDGASEWQVFRHITWPLLMPTTALVVILSVINTLRHFDTIWIMTNGGPGDATRVLAIYIYESAFTFFKMGQAAAASVVLFVCVLIFSLFQLRLFRSRW